MSTALKTLLEKVIDVVREKGGKCFEFCCKMYLREEAVDRLHSHNIRQLLSIVFSPLSCFISFFTSKTLPFPTAIVALWAPNPPQDPRPSPGIFLEAPFFLSAGKLHQTPSNQTIISLFPTRGSSLSDHSPFLNRLPLRVGNSNRMEILSSFLYHSHFA